MAPTLPAKSRAMPAAAGGLSLSDAEYARVQQLLHSRFGIAVDASKRPLVASKCARLVRQGGYASFAEYEEAELSGGRSGGLSDFIDQLTTNHTFWWREPAHFTFFRDRVLPEWEARLSSSRDLRTWCAVSSTGEEAWTLAMLQRQHFGERYGSWKAGVLATDISSEALRTASTGEYDAAAIANLPDPLPRRFFEAAGPGRVRVKTEVRRDVLYRRLNLMTRPLPFRAPMHVIFCRNVMIYFDPPTNRDLTRALHDALAPGGYLFVGHSEPLDRATCPLECVGPSIYRRRG